MFISPFAAVGMPLWQRGYSVIPIMPGEKAPGMKYMGKWMLMKEWNLYTKVLPSESDLNKWMAWPDANIGVTTGQASYLIALDFDIDKDDLHNRIQAVVPPSPVRKVGNRGFTAFYQWNGEENRKWLSGGECILELLSTGRQTVLPPSIHPSGGTYHYITEDTLMDVNAADLPILPANFCEMMDELFGIKPVRRWKAEEYGDYYGETSLEDVREALEYISPESYHEWVDVGMALQSGLGDAGFDIWDTWSQSSSKYKSKEMQRKWGSFRHSGITIATVFHIAMLAGYKPKPKHQDYSDMPELQIIEGDFMWLRENGYIGVGGEVLAIYQSFGDNSLIEVETHNPVPQTQEFAPKTHNQGIIPDDVDLADTGILVTEQYQQVHEYYTPPEPSTEFTQVMEVYQQGHEYIQEAMAVPVQHMGSNLMNPHGLVGDIVAYINSSALRAQPELAIGAALAFVGSLKGHRVESQTGVRSNIYIIGLGESCSGKDHARKCIINLAKRAGVDNMLIGVPKSGAALLKAVNRVSGRALCQVDEIGLMLASLTGKTAQAHQREVITNMMKLYSEAGGTSVGEEYATNDTRYDIEDPCLSIYGMTTQGHFYNSLTGSHVIDGFMNRIILVNSTDFLPDRNTSAYSLRDIPEGLLEKILAIDAMSTNPYELPNSMAAHTEKRPLIIQFTQEARSILSSFEDMIDDRRKTMQRAGDDTHAIWGRAPENAQKVALILQEGHWITEQDMRWACDYVTHWTDFAVDAVKRHVSDNIYEKTVKRVIEIIAEFPKKNRGNMITHRELSQRTSYLLKKRERDDIIRSLIDAETIFVETVERHHNQTLTYRIASE